MKYKERVYTGPIIEATGNQIMNLCEALPKFYKGHELKYYEVETMFRESERKWIIRIDVFDDETSEMIILKPVHPCKQYK